MTVGLRLVTPPTSEPVTLEQAKAHCRVVVPDDDALLIDLISFARDYVEDQTGVCFLTQTWEQTLDNFPYMNQPIDLLRWPVQSITSLVYTDAQGDSFTWDPSNYLINKTSKPPRIAPVFAKFWPLLTLQTLANVTITMVAGFTDVANLPFRYRQALLMVIAHWYENRELIDLERGVKAAAIPHGTEEILANLKPALYA